MAINKKLIHFNTKENFLKEKNAGNILNTSIVFIKDTREIWTHDAGYLTLSSDGEDGQIFGMTEEGPLWINRWKTLEEEKSPYEFVDLGLSVDWCTCNIGATKPEEYGWYFQWAGTTPYNSDLTPVGGGSAVSFGYNSNCPYWVSGASGNSTRWSKYTSTNTSSSTGIADNKLILDPEDDAVHIHLGGNWRMPTEAEYKELINACNVEWVSNYKSTSINGLLFTLKTDPSKILFFPAAGYLSSSGWEYAGSNGFYWSSSLNSSSPYISNILVFLSNFYDTSSNNRSYGLSIRAVKSKS